MKNAKAELPVQTKSTEISTAQNKITIAVNLVQCG